MRRALLSWFHREGRDLPWRRTRDPYAILVAEVMLQQTPVSRVIPKYLSFLESFPTPMILAQASRSDVIKSWASLGYNRRAVWLHQSAKFITNHWGGRVPQDSVDLLTLPGVGSYTAAAVACFAFGKDVPVIDTNVRRVLTRVFFGNANLSVSCLRDIAKAAVPTGEGWAWNQALMDTGSVFCSVASPSCKLCPLKVWCKMAPLFPLPHNHLEGKRVRNGIASKNAYKGSRRYYRGRAVEFLRGLRGGDWVHVWKLGEAIKPDLEPSDQKWLSQLIQDLEDDHLVKVSRHTTSDHIEKWVALA